MGPCVTNLNYYVDDIANARRVLSDLGAQVHMEGPSSIVSTLSEFGPDNTRPGSETRKFLYMGARHLIGFDLEIMEPNFLHFAQQTRQYPCFCRPHCDVTADGLRLERLRVAVDDLAETLENLNRILTPSSRSKPYAARRGRDADSFRIGVGGIELEYCAPLSKSAPLGRHLDRYGSGVVTAEFTALASSAVLHRARSGSSPFATEAINFVGEEGLPERWQLAGREIVGFDIVIEEEK